MQVRKPVRVERTYVQHLHAPPSQVLPLLCPVREADWIEGWDPRVVYSESGVAEPGCVFVTPQGEVDAVWLVTRLEREPGRVEMVKVTPGLTVCTLRIALAPHEGGTAATVSYAHTSLGPDGDAFVAGFTEPAYHRFMREWEARLNHYLLTGTRLSNAQLAAAVAG